MTRVSGNRTSPQPRQGGDHTATDDSQYDLLKIMTIWAIVAVPMSVLAFVIGPMLVPEGTWQGGATIWRLLIGGMIWQFIASVIILYRELDEFTWAAIKARIWLKAPQEPTTGKSNFKLFWWLIPAFLVYALFEGTPSASIIGVSILIPFSWISSLPYLELQSLFEHELVGAWWLIPVALGSCLFNFLLREELSFLGIMLPKMRGVLAAGTSLPMLSSLRVTICITQPACWGSSLVPPLGHCHRVISAAYGSASFYTVSKAYSCLLGSSPMWPAWHFKSRNTTENFQ